jgi:predicted XRE-type DNA-binding protein
MIYANPFCPASVSRACSEATAERLIREMALDELRAARALTQEHLSTILGVQQSAVSKLEHRADMYVSTLRHFIEAMGGQLEIRAVFPTATSASPSFGRSRRRRLSGTQCPLGCSGLQTETHGLVNNGDFEPTIRANMRGLEPTLAANEPRFRLLPYLVKLRAGEP